MTRASTAGSPDSWTRRARRAAGPAVVATRRWGAHGRVLPDFVVLGAQKSGTTTLYTQLTREAVNQRYRAGSSVALRIDACEIVCNVHFRSL